MRTTANACAFDKAMSAAVKAGKEWEGRKLRTLRDQLKRDAYEDRLCRHMLTGRVAYRKCGNDFHCETCEFDQNLEDVLGIEPEGEVLLTEASGYHFSDRYYHHEGHAWARVEYAGRVRIGMDEFAANLLGRADGWDLPGIGHRLVRSLPALALTRGAHRAALLSR